MLNLVTKLFVAVGGAATACALGYGLLSGDRAGAYLLVAAALAAFLAAAVTTMFVGADVAPTIPADAPAPERVSAFTPDDAPAGSPWAPVFALGLAGLAVGAAEGSRWLAFAGAALVIPAAGWLAQVWREHPSWTPRAKERVGERLLAPLAMPLLALMSALFVAVTMSRVLLAISPTAAWVIAISVAAAVLMVLWAVSARPTLRPSALFATSVVAVAGMAFIGVFAASAGERDFHPHESHIPIHVISAKNTTFSAKELEYPAATDVELDFVNYDVGTYHNVAFYSSTEPNARPLSTAARSRRGSSNTT